MQGKCHICGKYGLMERHHVFNGAYRKKSEKYGAVVLLCHDCHNEPPHGVHFNRTVMWALKEEFQRKLMFENNWSVQDFVQKFGKNYT